MHTFDDARGGALRVVRIGRSDYDGCVDGFSYISIGWLDFAGVIAGVARKDHYPKYDQCSVHSRLFLGVLAFSGSLCWVLRIYDYFSLLPFSPRGIFAC